MILGLHARPITMTCVPAPVSHASIHAHHSISLNSSLATYISHIYLYRCLCWLLRETRSVLNRLLPSIPYICALSSAAFRVRLGSRDRPARRNNLLACKTAALAGRETHPTTNILVPIAFPIWHWHWHPSTVPVHDMTLAVLCLRAVFSCASCYLSAKTVYLLQAVQAACGVIPCIRLMPPFCTDAPHTSRQAS
ncbi:hypothetical protein L207DRAFT_254875 [Hyaloscypha variabilis F]|uniref:Uncharacterized protein n=1 Tax=Hyaloscypha variabilis (strain UAMH 11265 / GT02V1 / F) TaxID=1149755 RepID=A0A2J6S3Q7_HYAVF|nr:hypothetical protein L207DRAFT_254875 [Hyaloscypha variabilis F]